MDESNLKSILTLPIKRWSATDYAYLVNNQLGWISDDDGCYVFNTEEEMRQFDAYLNGHVPDLNTDL